MKGVPQEREDLLRFISAVYLSFPVLLFVAAWVRWEIGWPVILLALGGLWSGFVSGCDFRRDLRSLFPSMGTLALVLTLVWLSGAAGCFSQRLDWLKHNSLLFDLVQRPWPIFYEGPAGALPLAYYIAYYLPAALVGKYFGMPLAFAALFIWTATGFYIVAMWLKAIVDRCRIFWVTLAFLFFSGWDVVGGVLAQVIYSWLLPDAASPWYRGESWSGLLQYSSHLNWVFWVPQHAISCWLFTALLLGGQREKGLNFLPAAIFAGGYSLLWSPFVSLGLIPIILVKLLEMERLRDLRKVLSLQGMGAAAVGGVSLLFFAAKVGPTPYPLAPVPVGLIFSLPGLADGISVVPMAGFSPVVVVGRVLLFILMEVGAFALPLWFLLKKDTLNRKLLMGVVLWLGLLPWFYCGLFNDLVMRSSGSALFVLAVLGLKELFSASRWGVARCVLAVVWGVGSLAPMLTFCSQIHTGIDKMGDGAIQPVVSMERSWLHAPGGGFFNTIYSAQYVGRPDSFFFRVMAKEAEGSGQAE